jgi:hypothetical protein
MALFMTDNKDARAAALTVCQQEKEEPKADLTNAMSWVEEAYLYYDGDHTLEHDRVRFLNIVRQVIEAEIALARREAEAAQRQLVARLRKYVQHDNNCKMIRCVECNGSRGNGRHQESWIPGSGVYWHEFTSQGACTCGLAALVAEQESK